MTEMELETRRKMAALVEALEALGVHCEVSEYTHMVTGERLFSVETTATVGFEETPVEFAVSPTTGKAL